MRLVIFALLIATACGSDPPPAPVCTGASCACPAGTACGFSEETCGLTGSCTLACDDHNDCEGTCSESCSIDCGGMSTCTATLGASGSVSCTDGSTCHITCTGSCSVSCSPDSSCDLRCPTDTQSNPVEASGSCP